MTRAMALLLDGEVARAYVMHPSAPWVGLWLAVQLGARLCLCILVVRPHPTWLVDLVLSIGSLALVETVPVVCAAAG